MAAVAVPMFALASAGVWQAYSNAQAQQQRMLLERAEAAAALIDRDFAMAESALRVLGGLPELARGNLVDIGDELRTAAAELGGVMIELVRPDGKIALSTAAPSGAQATGTAPDFVLQASKSGRPTVSGLIGPAVGGTLWAGVALPVPIGTGGRWALALYLPEARFAADLASLGLPDVWAASLADPAGRFIVRSPSGTTSLGRLLKEVTRRARTDEAAGVLAGTYRSDKGILCIAAFARARQTGYWAVVTMSEAEFSRPLRATLWRTGGLALLVAVAGLGMALLVSRRLAGALRRLARVPFESAVTGVLEIDELADALAGAERSAREGAERFRLLAQAMPDVVFMADAEGHVIYMNERFQEIAGLSPEDTLGDGWFAAVHPEDREHVALARSTAVSTGTAFEAEFRLRTPDGAERWMLTRAVPWRDAAGRVQCFVGFAVDVHDLRMAQAALGESEERLELATSAAALGIWDCNLLDQTIRLSPRGKAIYGLPPGPELVTFKMIRAARHPDDLPHTTAMARRALDPAIRDNQPLEYRILRPNGEARWVSAHGRAIFAEMDGRLRAVRYVGTIQDVTERKRIEQELRTSEARLRLAIDAGRMAVWEFKLATDSVEGSAELGRVLGFPEGHAPTMSEISARFAGSGEQLQEEVRAALSRGDKFVEVEGRYRWPDGSDRWMQLRCELTLVDGAFSGAIGVITDVTNRKATEAALQRLNQELEARVREEVAAREAAQTRAAHAERMQALGQLAGGIAHDFNNVLQAVTGGASLIERRPDHSETVRRFARLITDAAMRGSSITRRLLAFARRSDLRAEPLRAGDLLEGLSEILVHTLGSAIEIRLELPPSLPSMLADRGQLETVLVNLATNARDAMPRGGALTLSARPETVGAGHRVGLSPGRYIAVAVSDTGSGMDAVTLAHASEPFFTTKSRGKGTGLGLAMAKGFAEQSGGGLFIESAPDFGTTVTLWLPEAAEPVVMRAPPAIVVTAGKSHGRVLLVDDDGLVRDALAAQLEAAGYAVVSAQDGAEALGVLHTDLPVDCLVTDLSMPGMDGLALIREAQARRPRLPAVLLTGYAGDGTEIAVSGAVSGSFSLLRKPVPGGSLADRVSALLEAAASA